VSLGPFACVRCVHCRWNGADVVCEVTGAKVCGLDLRYGIGWCPNWKATGR